MTTAVVIGMGQLGSELAAGLEATGHTIVPVRRGESLHAVYLEHPSPEIVVVAVAEADLEAVLLALPEGYKDRVLLLQNELVPFTWQRHGIASPTVAVVWFEKKADKPRREILPTVVVGSHAQTAAAALRALGLRARVATRDALNFELVVKNAYILVTNIAGLEVSGTVDSLRTSHREVYEPVFLEVLAVQQGLFGEPVDAEAVVDAVESAFDADPEHACAGRSAPARLARLLAHAAALGIDVPTCAGIAAKHGIEAAS